ncbi:MAG: sigma-70 family RNA polymerase sigma factor [Myxococcota bacterium]
MDEPSDVELLDAWADGDEAAGRTLYRRHCDKLTDFVARKTDHDVADVVQRAFAGCLQARRGGTTIAAPRAYLYRSVRNALYDGFARDDRTVALDPSQQSLADLGTGPQTHALRNQAQAQLLEALRRIPLDDQVALELCYWEGLGMVEVADVLGVGRSAAISRVHRARARLRAALVRNGGSEARAEATVTSFESWQEKLRSDPSSPVYVEEPGNDAGDRD